MAENSTTKPEAEPPKPPDPETPEPNTAATSAATDTPPKKKRGRPKGSKNKTSTAKKGEPREPTVSASRRALVKKVDGFLKGPAFAFEAVGEEWPAKHIDAAAPPLAENLVTYCEKNPVAMARLEAFFEGGATAGLILSAAMYVLPLGMYFGVIPAPERAKAMLGVPDKPGTIRVENGIPGSWEAMPAHIREQVEAEAIESGFVLSDGSADVESFMEKINAAFQSVRSDIPNE